MKRFLPFLFFLSFITPIVAQTEDRATAEKNKEFFLSFTDFSPLSISIAHKRQLKNNAYLRFGLVDMSLQTSSNFSKNSIRSSISYSVGMEAGVEFRKLVTENFTFYHGPSVSATYGNNISRIDTLAIASVQSPSYTGAIPYSLGMLVKLNDHFLLAAEINPGITITYRKFSSSNYNISTDFSFSNRFALLSLAYRL
jgi:hypothetical protein